MPTNSSAGCSIGLKTRGLLDRAIVAIVSDHGEGLGDHGEAEHGILLYREALQVPWILRLPGGGGGGTRVAGTLGLVDVAATLLDLAGLDAGSLDGQTVRSALATNARVDRSVYSETFYPRLHLGWSDLASATEQHFRFIKAPLPELYDLRTTRVSAGTWPRHERKPRARWPGGSHGRRTARNQKSRTPCRRMSATV